MSLEGSTATDQFETMTVRNSETARKRTKNFVDLVLTRLGPRADFPRGPAYAWTYSPLRNGRMMAMACSGCSSMIQ